MIVQLFFMDDLTQSYSHVLPEVFDGVSEIVSGIHADMMADNETANTAIGA